MQYRCTILQNLSFEPGPRLGAPAACTLISNKLSLHDSCKLVGQQAGNACVRCYTFAASQSCTNYCSRPLLWSPPADIGVSCAQVLNLNDKSEKSDNWLLQRLLALRRSGSRPGENVVDASDLKALDNINWFLEATGAIKKRSDVEALDAQTKRGGGTR